MCLSNKTLTNIFVCPFPHSLFDNFNLNHFWVISSQSYDLTENELNYLCHSTPPLGTVIRSQCDSDSVIYFPKMRTGKISVKRLGFIERCDFLVGLRLIPPRIIIENSSIEIVRIIHWHCIDPIPLKAKPKTMNFICFIYCLVTVPSAQRPWYWKFEYDKKSLTHSHYRNFAKQNCNAKRGIRHFAISTI